LRPVVSTLEDLSLTAEPVIQTESNSNGLQVTTMLISPNGEMPVEGYFSNVSSKLDILAATLNLKGGTQNQKGFGHQETNSVNSSIKWNPSSSRSNSNLINIDLNSPKKQN